MFNFNTMKFFILPAALYIAMVTCAPSNYHVVHERRERGPEWVRRDLVLDKRAMLPTFSIALTQQSLHIGEQYLMDVADPTSPNYGKHWTPEKVVDTFAPDEEAIKTVKTWLIDSGISEERFELSLSRQWYRMNITIGEAENLLKTEYKFFEHKVTEERAIAVEEYSVPVHVRAHIDYIQPTLESTLLTRNQPRGDPAQIRTWKRPPKFSDAPADAPPMKFPSSIPSSISESTPTSIPDPPSADNSTIDVIEKRDSGVNALVGSTLNCDVYVTMTCIQKLYNMPISTLATSSVAVLELFTESYVAFDLLLFMYNFVTTDRYDISPTVYVMNDTVFTPGVAGATNTAEGNLDSQIAQGLVYPMQIWWYQANNMDVFFDAVDAAYCAVTRVGPCGSTPLASVISVSWGWYELLGDASQIRVCNEFMKLGLLGSTVLFASGDSGVGTLCTKFRVLESGSCPYITSVGGTQLRDGLSLGGGEVASNSYWSSGGGFSNMWPLPSWQASAMRRYYASYAPTYTAAQYNNSRAVRGYPDISAISHNLMTVRDSDYLLADGTSGSTPVVASLIGLINQQRLAAGKSTVGFINPVLYANPGAMNDIVSGNNPGCGTNGFSAVPGWDPVTGLGSPDYVKLLKVWMALA